MQGKARIKEHPIHPMLIPFPIAFWVGSLIADFAYFATDNDFWTSMGTTLIGFGIIGALLAAIAGFVDYFTAPMPARVKGTATKHMLVNLGITVLFVVNYLLRVATPETAAGYILSVIGIAALLYSGWLGGDLVYDHRVGVAEEGPRPGAPQAGERPRVPTGTPRR
ncbi:MAG TPA: DUF2231 domain-containing protein [bacterium]|nr:DUF2231 domain-containing protein [bacterium]